LTRWRYCVYCVVDGGLWCGKNLENGVFTVAENDFSHSRENDW